MAIGAIVFEENTYDGHGIESQLAQAQVFFKSYTKLCWLKQAARSERVLQGSILKYQVQGTAKPLTKKKQENGSEEENRLNQPQDI